MNRETYPVRMWIRGLKMLSAVVLLAGLWSTAGAQITTSSTTGRVMDDTGEPLIGANVVAIHEPSGTMYGTSTNEVGRYTLPTMRIGGPYIITASYTGYEDQRYDDIYLSLGTAATVNFTLRTTWVELAGVVITTDRYEIFSESRTGAATSIRRETVESMPTISRRLNDFTRLTPQASAGGSFAGQDNRLNNITVDGSYFNNSFGLAGQPGDRTGVSPISLDAIDAFQVNVAPYDVRQGNFVGAGVNTVTRSGTNRYMGSAYYIFRNADLVGTKAGESDFNPGEFDYTTIGFRLGGPIIRDKLFFFASFENESLTEPGTTFRARGSTEEPGGNVTRVLASDLDNLSNYLRQNFNYETGPYQNYDHETGATKFLLRLDYNLSLQHKLSLRYTHLDSDTDVLLSNSSSLGFGTRRTNINGLNFQNSNYKILENIRSIIGELNSMIGNNMSNTLILGYTYQDESRDSRGSFFPMVDILDGGSVYTTFGFEPFTPNNELRYKTFQLQNNLTLYRGDHTFTIGLSAERYESENVFFPGSQSVYVYNSLDDFYTDANDYLDNPDRTVSPVELRRFQVRWSNQPGLEKPIQPLKVFYAGVYGQDLWNVTNDLTLTYGLRIDVPFFGKTGFHNAEVDNLNFRDESGNTVRYSTDKLPDPNILWSPRIGFNWNPLDDGKIQVRGGSGIFTGRPAYVWISNQIGNNGVLTGFERMENTTDRPFHPNPDHYKPSNVTGSPASSYELAFTDPDFKFPQIWRSNIAVDGRLPGDLIGSVEFIYSKDVNGLYYINANLADPSTAYTGVDNRPRWTAGNRIHSNIDNAVVLKNQNIGSSWHFAVSLERPFAKGFYAKAAYSYGESKNTTDFGSIAFGAWNNNPHAGSPNNPGTGFAFSSPGHRIFAALSYRKEYFNFGATSVSLFWERRTWGNGSYTFSGDINGDGGTSNDLIYIHANMNEMNFEEFTASGTTFTAAQQAQAWNAFIEQDPYLSKNRGKYAERGAAFLPMVSQADFSIAQEVFTNFGNSRNTLQFRVDILNVGNLIKNDWGVGQRFTSTQPLIARPADAEGRVLYRMRNIGSSLMSESYTPTAGVNDVYRIQFAIRYTFN